MEKEFNINNPLNDRENLVLKAVVLDYIRNAFPVSSKQVCNQYIRNLSTATIRNTMYRLEKRGYISQPYTSAGRIPTDKGYRYYVDAISRHTIIKDKLRKVIEKEILEASADITLIMDKASHLLGKLSRELGVFVAPTFLKGILEKVKLVPLASNKVLVVLQIRSGLVKTIVIDMENEIKEHRFPLITSVLNERLCGVSLSEITDTIEQRFSDLIDDSVVSSIIKKAPKVFNFSQPTIAKLSGTSNLMLKPDFHDLDKLSQIVMQIEDGTIIAHISENRKGKSGIVISIGSENEDYLLLDFSVITKDYEISESKGLVAVIGPKRMNYPKAITLVDCIADVVNLVFDKNMGEK